MEFFFYVLRSTFISTKEMFGFGNLWSIKPVVEDSIHIPDIRLDGFHCSARTSFDSPPPEHYVAAGVPHPTIQFTTPDMKFFHHPFIHVKAQWVDRRPGQQDVLWDAVYKTPPKTSADKAAGATPMWSSLDHRAELVTNKLKPGGVSWVHMKRICIPPDGNKHRLLVTVNAADHDQVDIPAGPMGLGVYSFKHSFGRMHYLHDLNRGIKFL